MTQEKEALKLLQEVLAGLKDVEKQVHELVAENKALKEALAQPDHEAIAAIREALAQKEHEPHSWYSKQEDEWMTHKTRKEHERLNSYTHKVGKFDLALYTTPPQRTWVGLTDEDVEEVERWVEFKEEGSGRIPMGKLVRYIETKLKEKTRTWVGLSTDEFKFIASKYLLSREAGLEYFQEEIEAKSKEKNT